MSKILVLSGENHRFDASASVIHDFLAADADISATLTDEKTILASSELNSYDACVFGTGFTRTERQADGSVARVSDLTPEEEAGLFRYVSDGRGLVGIHGTAWWIGGRAVDLIGGHANWHPPGSTFTVHIEDTEHPTTQGLEDFDVEDEIYISAHEPDIHVLASAEWFGKAHPMAWVKPYGSGRVFYTTLGHGPGTFERAGMQQFITQAAKWAANA